MLTFARLVALILFAGLAWYVSEFLIEPLFEEGFDAGLFAEVNAVVGAICGWQIMGKRATGGIVSSVSIGFTTVLMMVFWALFVHSFYDMITRSLRRQYDGPVEAVIAVFELGAEHFMTMFDAQVWATLVAGGMIAGLVTGIFGRIWR